MTTVEKPLRRDAERNRRRILDAARTLFAERGLCVTLDDIADRAGLGVGTVYRRFASRDELIEALFEQKMVELVTLAEEALAVEDPWQALAGFIERVTERQAADRGLREVLLRSPVGRERVGAIRDRMRPLAEELVRRAQAAGVARPDLDPSDLPLLQMMLATIADVATQDRPDLWRRYLGLMLDGMRAEAARGELPAALGVERIEDVMCRWRPAPMAAEPRR